jgi:hypothetical protein
MLLRHTWSPVARSTANRLPAESGKNSRLPSTVGVADTSPPVVNRQCSASVCAFPAPIDVSAAWKRLFCRFCPPVGQSAADAGPHSITASTTAANTAVIRADENERGVANKPAS